MYQGFILGDVVRRTEVHLQHVLQLVSLGRGEDDADPQTLEQLGAIEVHAPVGGVWSRWQVLVLSPVSKEIRYDLRLDCHPGLVLNVMSSELNRPFGHSS
jgi:hypothetical protein